MIEPTIKIMASLEKLTTYSLSVDHPEGRHKARVFDSVLGITLAHAAQLRQTIEDEAERRRSEFRVGRADSYGTRYVLDFLHQTKKGQAIIRTAWIMHPGTDVLRLTSCYVL
jgi:hypothetical protein